MPIHESTQRSSSPAAPAIQAFVAGLEQNQAALATFVRNLVSDLEEARDVVQETFVDAWRATLRGRAPFTGTSEAEDVRRWLFHVAYQRAISVRRHRAVLVWHSLDAGDYPEPPEYAQPAPFEERLVEEDTIRRALAQLEPDEAACIILKVVQGFAAPEIARILDISSDAARQRLSRALRRLRAMYVAQERQGALTGERPEEGKRR